MSYGKRVRKVLVILPLVLLTALVFLVMPAYASPDGLVSSFSRHYQTTTTSTNFHLAIGLAAPVYVPEWEVWPGGPIVPARWDIDWQIARAPTYKIFNHATPGAFLFEDIQFDSSDVGKTFTISSVSDDSDFDDFAAFLTNGTDDNIWEAWIWPMHPTNNAGGIRCAHPQGPFFSESNVFSGTDVGTDFPGYVIQSVSLTFDDITTSSLTIDYTVDIAYGPLGDGNGNGGNPGAPTDFILTYVNDYEVGINWTKGVGANMTMVRAAVGGTPEGVTDGYEVYYGTGAGTVDTALSLASPDNTNYAAWSQDTGGTWSTSYASADTGGLMSLSFFFVVMVGLAFALFLAALRWKPMNLLVSMAAMLMWLAIGFWWVISPPFADFGLPPILLDVLGYMPFMLFIGIIADMINRWGRVEIQRTIGGKTYTEIGTPPRGTPSGYDKYRRELLGRTRR